MTPGILFGGLVAYIATLVGWVWWRRRKRPRKPPEQSIAMTMKRHAEFLDDERH